MNAPVSSDPGIRSDVLRLILFALAVAALALSIATAGGAAINARVGPLRLTSQTPDRALIVGSLAVLGLLVSAYRHRVWRRLSLAIGAVFGVVAFVSALHATGFNTGDGALIELSTLHAIRGRQLLGAYSQSGWHHPGPLVFYWLAPFYWMGRLSAGALNAGVLAGNLVSLAIVLTLLVRHAGRSVGLPIACAVGLTFYLAQAPLLLVSGWNPHVPVLALMALTVVAACSLAGATAGLTPALILGSVVVQAHVGYAAVASVLCAITLLAVLRRDWRLGDRGLTLRRRLVTAVFIAQALWLLPVAEQLVHTPGNMTLLVRFFTNPDPPQAFAEAWRAWGTMLVAPFMPGFDLAFGHGMQEASVVVPLAGTLLVALLLPVAVWNWLRGERLLGSLAIACASAAVAGLWSVREIRGLIGDYHIFWLSALGVLSAATVVAAVASRTADLRSWRVGPYLAPGFAAASLLSAVALALPFLMPQGDTPLPQQSVMVRTIVDAVAKNTAIRDRTVVSLSDHTWQVGAGVVLQMTRVGYGVTVPSDKVWMFGDAMRTTGDEDQLLLVIATAEHLEISKGPGPVTIAYSDGVFADLVNLRDHPEFRPR